MFCTGENVNILFYLQLLKDYFTFVCISHVAAEIGFGTCMAFNHFYPLVTYATAISRLLILIMLTNPYHRYFQVNVHFHAMQAKKCYKYRIRSGMAHEIELNSLTTNDAYMCHDPCELSISLWEFIWSIKY